MKGIRVTFLNRRGHQTETLSPDEVAKLIHAESGRYYVVDPETRKILREVKIEEHEALMLVPVIGGG